MSLIHPFRRALGTLSPDAKSKIRNVRRRLGLLETGPILSHFASRVCPSLLEPWHRKRTFQAVYREGKWGVASGETFYSGAGSRGAATGVYVDCIAEIIATAQRERQRPVRVIDLGCGDFVVGRQLVERVPDMIYTGCDIVPELILHHSENSARQNVSFQLLDIVTDVLPDGDIVLVRQVLQHLSNQNVKRILDKLSKFDAVYITEGHPVSLEGAKNPDKPIGSGMRFDWRTGRGRGLEFDAPPFNLLSDEICRVSSGDFENVITFRVECREIQRNPS